MQAIYVQGKLKGIYLIWAYFTDRGRGIVYYLVLLGEAQG